MTLRTPSGLGPATGLVDLARAKQDLRVDHGDEDFKIQRLILAASQRVEALTQRRYIAQTLEWVLPRWPAAVIRLPVAPVNEVVSVTYADQAGAAQILPSSDYVVSPHGATKSIRMKRGQTWPLLDTDAAEPVVIRFTTGGQLADVPAAAQAATLLIVAQLYDNAEKGPTPEDLADLLWDEMWA